MKKLIVLILACLWLPVFSQTTDKSAHLGVKMGLNSSTILGGKFDNQRPRFGIQTGLYIKKQTKKQFGNFAEIEMAFTGSNFKHQTKEYSRINFLVLNTSFCKYHNIGERGEVLFGLQGAFILSNELYAKDELKAIHRNLPFRRIDPQIKLGWANKGDFSTLLLEIRFSLLNIGEDIELTDLEPTLNKNGNVKNFSIACSLLF